MPYTPKITTSIPAQNFELIRDAIAGILAAELANQYSLNNAYPNLGTKNVWVERFVTFDSSTEVPAVNVVMARGEYSNQTTQKMEGEYLYHVDVYTSASSTDADDGDVTSMKAMHQILGMVRAILGNGAYKTLGFAPGVIGGVKVVGLQVMVKGETDDCLSNVVGRLSVSVRAIETSTDGTGVPLNIGTLTVLTLDPAKGYFVESTLS